MTLEEGGYYDSIPYLAPCRPEHAQDIAAKVRGFVGQGRWQPSSAHCRAFASQFPPRLRPLLNTAFAQQFELLHPDTASAYLLRALNSLRAVAGATKRFLLLTGLSPDSGNMSRMFFEHYTRGSQSDVMVLKDLHEALGEATSDDIIVLCDDNIGSGTQAQAQFRAWMNVPSTEWPPAQQREGGIYKVPLTGDEQKKLTDMRFGLAMCVGKKGAEAGLRSLMEDLGLSKFLGLHLGDNLDDRPKTHIDAQLYEFLN